MLKLEQALLVEGKYDAARLANLVDGTILTTDGFRVFRDGALQKLLKRISAAQGLIILTDSDAAVVGAVGRAGNAPFVQVGIRYGPQLCGFLLTSSFACQRCFQSLQNQIIVHALDTQQTFLAGFCLAGFLTGDGGHIGLQHIFRAH